MPSFPRYNISAKVLLWLLFNLVLHMHVQAQVTRIRGEVFDLETNEPLPFVNVSLQGTNIGTTTGFNGEFFIETRNTATTLVVSYMGYLPYSQKIKPGAYQSLVIYLNPESIELNEIVVKPGENPAHVLLRKVIDHKEENNPEKVQSYQYEVYNKMELDINNVKEAAQDQKAFKAFKFIFDYVDTSAITGKTFLPVFITETLSDYYFQKDPRKQKEIIKASKISGVESDRITDFTGKMYLDFNIYDNMVPIMTRDMVSPIASFGLMYYKYYLIDSAFIDDNWCYQISFEPKRKQEPTFTGYFWIHDTTFAVQNFKIRLAEGVNINWVSDFVAEQTYTRVADSVWFPQRQELFVDFGITNKEYGFFGRKTTSYQNIVLDPELDPEFFSRQFSQETEVVDGANTFSHAAWDSLRPMQLSERESDIYKMVDSIQELPLYNTVIDIITMFVTGYYVVGPVEIGPYFTLYSFNPIEGHRFKLGLRTSNDFSTKIMLFGHLAYGTRDQKIKHGAGAQYMFNKNPRRTAQAYYYRDYELLGISENAFQSDNILASIFARKQNDKLTTVNEAGGYYEHEWFPGLSNTLKGKVKQVYASETVPFQYVHTSGDTVDIAYIGTTEITLNTRLAFNEKFVLGEFERLSLGTKYPIINIDFTAGLQGILGGDYEYYKLHLSVEHKFPIHPFGDFKYILDVGQVFGNVPFPFLQIHEGNQTYAYDKYAYNLMNYYEFVSTRYISLMVEQHFNGLFLNHIPLFRRLKWREVAGFKALGGDITQRSSELMLFPETLDNLDRVPYMEAGLAIENIFKFFRVDAVWRLSYLDHPDVIPFGILAKMQIRF